MSGIRSILSDFRDASRARVSGVRVRRGGSSLGRISAVALALVILVSMLAMPLGASVATAQSGPSGMVALGPDQVDEDLPSNADVPIRASDLEDNVYASDHAGSLQITVTTPERASDYMGENANVIADDEIAIVLTDDEVHEGRDVAVDLDVLEAGVGYVPDVAYGVHDSGEEWQSEIEQTDGVGRFHVDEFSSNSVTFSGGIELSGSAAADGTNYQYELDNLNGVEDYAINLTGVENTEQASTSGTFTDGDSTTIDVGGTTAPRDETVTLTGIRETDSKSLTPGSVSDGYSESLSIGGTQSAEDATVTLTGHSETSDQSVSGSTSGSVTESISVGGTEDPTDATITLDTTDGETRWSPSSNEQTRITYTGSVVEDPALISDPPQTIDELGISAELYSNDFIDDSEMWADVDIYLSQGNNTDDPKSGTKVASTTLGDTPEGVEETIEISDYDTGGASQVTIGWDVTDAPDYGSVYFYDTGGYIDVRNAESEISVSHTGGSESISIESGSSTTEPIDFSTGSNSVDISGDYEPLDYTITWTEESITRDPSVTIDGSTVSHTGTLADGETVTESVSLSPGSTSLDVLTGHEVGVSASWTEVSQTEDPSVTVGGSTVSHTGTLADGETVTESVDLSAGSTSLDVSTGHEVNVAAEWTEVSNTRDPVVEVNGYETEYNGVLSEGETTSLATNEAWLQEGTNNVTVRTNTPSNGPESLVDMTYSHDASGVTKSVDVEATSWTESFNVSHTFPSAVADADATLTFDEQVAQIHDVEYRIDGGSWQAPPSYDLNGTDLNVALGDVEAEAEIDVRATGHKVRAYDGAVKVTEPTVEGDDLATEVEITDINPDGMFGLRVDETVLGDRLHYASEESWTGESAHASITSSGTQILRAPDANEGSTMRVSTAPVSISPQSGAIEAEVEDGSEPTFSLRKGNTTGSDRIEVTYYNTVTGDRYVLWSETREVEVDADRAESPVSFVTSGSSETYSILQRDAGDTTTDGYPVGPSGQEGTLSLVLSFVGIGGVLVGSTFVSRRFNIGGWLLPVTATSLTAVAIQVLSPGSPLLRVAQLASESNAVTIGAVAALLIGMWQLDERTQGSVPWYVRGIIGLLSVVWALETISPGVILGGLRSGVESMGPLIVIVIVGGGAYLIREWIQARRAPDTVINAQLGREK